MAGAKKPATASVAVSTTVLSPELEFERKRIQLAEELAKFAVKFPGLYEEGEKLIQQTNDDFLMKTALSRQSLADAQKALEEQLIANETKIQEATQRYEDTLATFELSKADSAKKVEELKASHAREMEQLNYDYKIAVERLKLDTLNSLLTGLSLESAPKGTALQVQAEITKLTTEVAELTSKKDAAIKSMIDAKSDVKDAKMELETYKKITDAEMQQLRKELAKAEETIKGLQAQVISIPTQITEAVKAASSNHTIQMTGK